jgi:GNAT superfamily N-acetyltransferase
MYKTAMPSFNIRDAAVDDAASIAKHRVSMFADMGAVPSDEHAAQLLEASVVALRSALAEGSYKGWLAFDEDRQVVGGAGVHIKPQLPRIASGDLKIKSGPVPLVVNVYTEKPWRHRGVARALMKSLLNWARENGFDRVLLHASDAGRPLYTALGFQPTNEMRWTPHEL